MNTKFTVIGTGYGGKAMAAHLVLTDFPVILHNHTFNHVLDIQKRGRIDLESSEAWIHGLSKIEQVTSDMGETLRGIKIIISVGELTRYVNESVCN